MGVCAQGRGRILQGGNAPGFWRPCLLAAAPGLGCASCIHMHLVTCFIFAGGDHVTHFRQVWLACPEQNSPWPEQAHSAPIHAGFAVLH